jgi:hypothetical protein
MNKEALSLTPPLLPPASHDGIPFIVAPPRETLSPETVAAIAFALNALLPPGDLRVTAQGEIGATAAAPTAWESIARLEAISRSPV